MAKSRMPLLLIALAWAGAGQAQSTDGQALIEAQREQLRRTIRPSCPPDEEEIVVCGRRDDDRYRVPIAAPVGGPPANARAGGEQRAAMAQDDRRCTPIGRDQQCNGGISVIGAAFMIARAIARAVIDDD